MARPRQGRSAARRVRPLLGRRNKLRPGPQSGGARRTQTVPRRVSRFSDNGPGAAVAGRSGDRVQAACRRRGRARCLHFDAAAARAPAPARGSSRTGGATSWKPRSITRPFTSRFATSEQAREAGRKLDFLRSSLGAEFLPLSIDQRFSHAAMLFNAKNWRDARNEYAAILAELSGADRERAELRILECGVALGARSVGGGGARRSPIRTSTPSVSIPSRSFTARSSKTRMMVAAVEAAVSRAPSSHWAESALFMAGNYYWVQLDRDRACELLQASRRKFSDVAGCRCRAVARCMDRCPEAPARQRRNCCKSICGVSRARRTRPTHCTGSAAWPRKRERPRSRAATT